MLSQRWTTYQQQEWVKTKLFLFTRMNKNQNCMYFKILKQESPIPETKVIVCPGWSLLHKPMIIFKTSHASANKTCSNCDYGNSHIIIIVAYFHHKQGCVHDKLPTLHSLLGQQDMAMLFSTKNSLNYLSLAKDLYLFRGF